MRTARWAAVVAATAVTASVGPAQPQPAGPAAPTFSPYLNLLNRGSPAINYYGIIRPQQQFAQQLGQVNQRQRQIAANLQRLNGDLEAGEYGVYGQSVYGINPRLRTTGFIPAFNNTGHYFSTNPARGGGGGGTRVGGGANGVVSSGLVNSRFPSAGGPLGGTGGRVGTGVGGVRR